MTLLTDIDDFRLKTFLNEYETHVNCGKNQYDTLYQALINATDWLGAMQGYTVIRFSESNIDIEWSFNFFAKYHKLHEDLSSYLALINFIRKYAKHFEDDSMDELNHNLSHYKVYKTHGMVFLMSRLKTYGFDIVDVDFSEFVKLEHTLQNPVL